MGFLIADSFTDSLARLTGEEQKAVKTTAFDLQLDPASPGMQFHKLDKARDKNFWSVRVNKDIRLIVHKTSDSLLLCYVDHHDKAYAWAERRQLKTHPTTGAAQLIELRETVQEIVVPTYVAAAQKRKEARALLAGRSDEELLSYGVPPEWLADVKAATEESILQLVEHLPAEAAEALLELATGGKPRPPVVSLTNDPFAHPDAQRRFRVMADVEELARALEFPWEKWSVFLHPEQRQIVERDFVGPARVSGSAGTGKTIVALHRAVHLARKHPGSRVLLTTFSDPLAEALRTRLNHLVAGDAGLRERIDVESLPAVARRLYREIFGEPSIVEPAFLKELLHSSAKELPQRFAGSFLVAEWNHVVDPWQIHDWEAYRDVSRLGRKTRLSESQRRDLWTVFEGVWKRLTQGGLLTEANVYAAVASQVEETGDSPYDYVVVDEAQDLGVPQLRFVAALAQARPNSLFFAGDAGQRIFQQPFSWKSLGIDVRGRSRTLRVNYRTSHQIRMQADRLLGPEVTDADGNRENRSDTVSVFNGPAPAIRRFDSEEDERDAVATWLRERVDEGVRPHEIGIFVRSIQQLDRATAATEAAGLTPLLLDDQIREDFDRICVGTMHVAKGLEFRAVAVMACDDEIIPLQERIETVGDDGDLQEVYDTERQLLYVACTRARDYLLVTCVEPGSEFLDDMQP